MKICEVKRMLDYDPNMTGAGQENTELNVPKASKK